MASGYYASAAQVDGALGRASAYILGQAGGEFAEARHEMVFSRAAGFSGSSERQSSDIFARATLAHLFLDIAGYVHSELAAELRTIARREAYYIAHTKVANRAGGWSYFPDLPELPPDADSLAAALSLFVRIAPEYTSLCREPVELVLAGADPDGAFETWIVAPADAPPDRERMEWAIRNCWGTGADPDVLAHFYYALYLWEFNRYEAAVRRGASKLIEMQQPDGSWRATWYSGPAYGTGQAVRLLRAIGMGDEARERAYRYLLKHQREDGGWGEGSSVALQTALTIAALNDAMPGCSPIEMTRAAGTLRTLQLADGSWPASPWIQMEIGRATGRILHVATYQSVTLTTAFCLRALLIGASSIAA